MTGQLTGQGSAKTRTLTLLAFFAIYFIWGSTFLAIRVAVETVPPLFAAGVRFTIAGSVLYAWARARGEQRPSRLEWRNLAAAGALMFLVAYSGLFWAEKTLPSGIAAVLAAMIPLWTALLQIFVLCKERFHWLFGAAIVMGIGGVAVLALDSVSGANLAACLAMLGAAISWSTGTVLAKVLVLPKSMLLNSGGQMLLGGLMLLACSALFGEMKPFPVVPLSAGLAILYLIVAGSIIAFTAYLWLLARLPATVVTSYAYVNPVVALWIGHWLGKEALGWRTALGAGLVLASLLIVGRGVKH